jgi:dipeptidyl aminopeptidase/acylaminoacyl peptidase
MLEVLHVNDLGGLSELRLDGEVEFFTSRGFAVADVDYRGSTGYGRRFRTALNGRWGVADVEDCVAVARSLVAAGRARADAVFISGASAGGYTALRAVSRRDTPFALAVARSAIVSPNRWTVTAPRFQRAHAATLAHAAADVEPDRVCRPVVLIHGHDDPVAPVTDVADLAANLDERRLLRAFMDLPGVSHSLSTPAASIAALHCELAAYEEHLNTARS